MNDLTIKSADESLETWKDSGFLSGEMKKSLSESNLLFVPEDVAIDGKNIRCFPEGTQNLVDFLSERAPDSLKWNVCIDENEYLEYSRHADVQIIAGAVVTLLAAPLFVNLLAEYIKRRCGIGLRDTTVKTSLTISDEATGKTLALEYDGPAETLEKVMLEGIKSNFAIREGSSNDNYLEREPILVEAVKRERTDDAG